MAMIKNHFIIGVLFLCALNLQAQFTDDMESYNDGEPISENYWTDAGCGGGEGCSLMSSSVKAHGGLLSGLIPGDGTTRAVLDLGNKIFGRWFLDFWIYIPEGKEASYLLQQEVPVSIDTPFSRIYFNKNLTSPGIGVIENTYLGDISFNFPHNEWFRIVMNWDIYSGISLATWQFNVDSVDVLSAGTPFTDENGTSSTNLGGMEFFSRSINNEMYLDDIEYEDEFIILSNDDFLKNDFILYPNPSKEVLHIQSNENIKNIVIYNVLGKSILRATNPNSIDTSSLAEGIYFVVVETDKGSGTQKLIKN